MLCGVTATLGSNPSATATAARPHWGRAVLLCLACMCGVLVAPLVFRVPEGPAVGPGCLVCPWAVARPRAVRAACCCLWPRWCSGRRRARPPARLGPHFVRRRASKPARALRSLRRPPHRRRLVADMWLGASARCPASPRHRPLISHVIPLRLVQSLNLHRWNCNVFGVSRKMTTINYVRNLGGGAAGSLMCALRVDSLSGQAPPPPTGTAAGSLYSLWASRGSRVLSFWGALVRVVTNVVNPRCFSCGFLIRCYERRQSGGFFAENGGFLA